MFSTPEYLKKRTGKNKVDRPEFLKLLVNEYKVTQSESAKEQVLANLANFAYDPINYEYLRGLSVIDIFLDELSESNPTRVEFAIAGICNLCLDKANKEYILSNDGIKRVSKCLSSADEEVVVSAITTLLYLVTPQSKAELTSPEIVQFMVTVSNLANPRLKNLASIFLSDICTPEQVQEAEMRNLHSIPVPD